MTYIAAIAESGIGSMSRECIKCRTVKVDSAFHKNKNSKSGLVNVCKVCKSQYDFMRGQEQADNNALLRTWGVVIYEEAPSDGR